MVNIRAIEIVHTVKKVHAEPFVVILTLATAFFSFIFCYAVAVLNVVSGISVLISVALFIMGQTLGGGIFLFLASLLSPFGLPAIAEWLVDRLNDLNYSLRSFITS